MMQVGQWHMCINSIDVNMSSLHDLYSRCLPTGQRLLMEAAEPMMPTRSEFTRLLSEPRRNSGLAPA